MNIKDLPKKHHLGKAEEGQFLAYISNQFIRAGSAVEESGGSFLEKWRDIHAYADTHTAAEALNRFVSAKRPVDFLEPDKIRIELYESFAGPIPIIYIKNTDDFEAFITNAIYKGIRPDGISETGASFAFGKKTRFITLSAKPYSNVPAEEIGISLEEWQDRSMVIRREHECTHYFTKCRYGLSRNNLHDEIMADFFGLYEAFGSYKAGHFLKFMGMEGMHGNRMEFYTKGLSEAVAGAVREVAAVSAGHLETWSGGRKFRAMTRTERIEHLCLSGLDGMFSGEAL